MIANPIGIKIQVLGNINIVAMTIPASQSMSRSMMGMS